MYTAWDVRKVIGNGLQLTTGITLNAIGSVKGVKIVEHHGYVRCFGNV